MCIRDSDCLAGLHGKLSSSDIRLMIQNGQMEKAAAALGSRFFVTGTVGHGKRLGSRHNTPTVNIKIDAGRVVPKYGVYITQTVLDGKKYNGITNVGVRPSVENTDIANIETNLFDFDAEIDVYKRQVRLLSLMTNCLSLSARRDKTRVLRQSLQGTIKSISSRFQKSGKGDSVGKNKKSTYAYVSRLSRNET